MELVVKPYTMPEAIEFNFDELKAALTEKVKDYETALYTDDQIKTAKEDRAALNRLKKALNDERIRREKEYMIPFTEFKTRVNEIISIIDKPIAAIDTQIKAYDEERKQQKEITIRETLAKYNLPYDINVNLIWNERWLNATFSIKDVVKEIEDRVAGILDDVRVLEDLTEDQNVAILRYKKDLDLRAALAEVTKARAMREELERIEKERKTGTEQPKQETPAGQKKEEAKVPEETPNRGQWVSFAAFLNVDTAKTLKQFLNEQGIPFKRIIA